MFNSIKNDLTFVYVLKINFTPVFTLISLNMLALESG